MAGPVCECVLHFKKIMALTCFFCFFFKYIIQCLVSEIWKMNRTSSYICASTLRILTNTIMVIHINRNTSSYIRTYPQPQAVLQWRLSIQTFLPLCVQLWSTTWARSASLWLTQMWRHDNNMHVKHTQNSCFVYFYFNFFSKAILSTISLSSGKATSGSWFSGNICLVILLLVCARSDGKALACPSGCLTNRRCFWIYL